MTDDRMRMYLEVLSSSFRVSAGYGSDLSAVSAFRGGEAVLQRTWAYTESEELLLPTLECIACFHLFKVISTCTCSYLPKNGPVRPEDKETADQETPLHPPASKQAGDVMLGPGAAPALPERIKATIPPWPRRDTW